MSRESRGARCSRRLASWRRRPPRSMPASTPVSA
jgi:hypothetical protein